MSKRSITWFSAWLSVAGFLFLALGAVPDYEFIDYYKSIEKMQNLSDTYPNYVQLHDPSTENGYLGELTSCNGTTCKYNYLTVTDYNRSAEEINSLPQVFLTAGVHGDERIGPTIVLEFIEYLLQNKDTNSFLKHLIQDRLYIILPVANAQGFSNNEREEKQGAGELYDVNRDFPYNTDATECMQTVAARVINHIYRSFLIKSALSFHGGVISISYPWGSVSHKTGMESHEAPDDQAYNDVAQVFVSEASSNTIKGIEAYTSDRISDMVYDINGIMEDWSYAASWEQSVNSTTVPNCAPTTLDGTFPASETTYNDQQLRSFTYLVHASDEKDPPLSKYGNPSAVENPMQSTDGLVPRNIRICFAMADLTEHSVHVSKVNFTSNKTFEMNWKGWGCVNVDSTILYHRVSRTGDDVYEGWITHTNQSGAGYWTNKTAAFQEVITLDDDVTSFEIKIELSCDSQWSVQDSPSPTVAPQSHMVQSKLSDQYYATSSGFVINTTRKATYFMEKMTLTTLAQLAIEIEEMEPVISISDETDATDATDTTNATDETDGADEKDGTDGTQTNGISSSGSNQVDIQEISNGESQADSSVNDGNGGKSGSGFIIILLLLLLGLLIACCCFWIFFILYRRRSKKKEPAHQKLAEVPDPTQDQFNPQIIDVSYDNDASIVDEKDTLYKKTD